MHKRELRREEINRYSGNLWNIPPESNPLNYKNPYDINPFHCNINYAINSRNSPYPPQNINPSYSVPPNSSFYDPYSPINYRKLYPQRSQCEIPSYANQMTVSYNKEYPYNDFSRDLYYRYHGPGSPTMPQEFYPKRLNSPNIRPYPIISQMNTSELPTNSMYSTGEITNNNSIYNTEHLEKSYTPHSDTMKEHKSHSKSSSHSHVNRTLPNIREEVINEKNIQQINVNDIKKQDEKNETLDKVSAASYSFNDKIIKQQNITLQSFLFCSLNRVFHPDCCDKELSLNILRLTNGNFSLSLKILISGANLPNVLFHEKTPDTSANWSSKEIEIFKECMKTNIYKMDHISKKIKSKEPEECLVFFRDQFYGSKSIEIKRIYSKCSVLDIIPKSIKNSQISSSTSKTKLSKLKNLFSNEFNKGALCERCYYYLTFRNKKIKEHDFKHLVNKFKLEVNTILTTPKNWNSYKIRYCQTCGCPTIIIKNLSVIRRLSVRGVQLLKDVKS